MRSLLLCAIVLLSFMHAVAQESTSVSEKRNVRFGVTTGMNVSSPTNMGTKVGYQLGVRGEWYLRNRLQGPFLSFGVLLTAKPMGQKNYVYGSPMDVTARVWETKANPTYLEVPLHFGWRWRVNDKMSIFASAGMYANFGAFGKIRTTGKAYGNLPVEKYSNRLFSFDGGEFVFCDWGVGYRVGADIGKHYQIALSQDWGLRNMNDFPYQPKIMNRNFALSFSYMF